jgi:hypothetical protein
MNIEEVYSEQHEARSRRCEFYKTMYMTTIDFRSSLSYRQREYENCNPSAFLRSCPRSFEDGRTVRYKQKKQSPCPLIRKRTIPTERQPLVDEI